MTSRRPLVALGLLCLLASLPVPAPAATVRAEPVPEAGPALAGSAVVWAAPRSDGGFAVVQAAGGDRRTIAKVGPMSRDEEVAPELAASAERIGVAASRTIPQGGTDFPGALQYLTGPLGGPLAQIGSCERAGGQALRRIDVHGAVVARRTCDSQAVVVTDPARPEVMLGDEPGRTLSAPRVAGTYVAVLSVGETNTVSDIDIVVYDRTTGAQVYRVPASELPGGVVALDLQDDGKVAFAFETVRNETGRVAVGWASPQEPRVHRMSLPERVTYDVRMAADRIGYQRPVKNPFGRTEVGVAGIDGSEQLVARGAVADPHADGFDLDAARVAWVRMGCSGAEVVTASATARRPASSPTCPLRLRLRPVVTGDRVRLDIDCSAFTRGACTRTVTLRAAKGGKKLGSASAQTRRSVSVKLTSAGRAALAGGRTVRTRIAVALRDESGGIQRRVGTFTLRR